MDSFTIVMEEFMAMGAHSSVNKLMGAYVSSNHLYFLKNEREGGESEMIKKKKPVSC